MRGEELGGVISLTSFSRYLWSSVLGSGLLGILELWHYRGRLEMGSRLWDPATETAGLAALVVWKSLVLLLLVALPVGVADKVGWSRTAKGLALGWGAVVFVWLGLDLASQRLVGNHILDYLPFLVDIIANPQSDLVQVGGGGALAKPISLTVVVSLLYWLALWKLGSRVPQRRVWNISLSISVALMLAGGLAAQFAFYDSSLLIRANKLLPLPVDALSRLGVWLQPARSVQIVGLEPQPFGKEQARQRVLLFNYGSGAQDLTGWTLRSRAFTISLDQHLAAQKKHLAAQETLDLELPAGEHFLNDSADVVGLYDLAGRMRHKVQYSGLDIRDAGFRLSFWEPTIKDPFLRQLDQALEPSFTELRKAMGRGRQPDSNWKVAPAKPINVVFFAVESLRSDAISEKLTPKLWALSSQGIRGQRHYAATNASHLGIYSLLFGRVPLVYKRDLLEPTMAPQLTASLRQAGYTTHFLTSGPFYGWRWMERFCNAVNFDTIWVPEGVSAPWSSWAKTDKKLVDEVRRLAKEDPERPKLFFCFQKSTHYPYSFPEAYDRYQPSGPSTLGLENWEETDTSQLRNRYKNSVAYTEDLIVELYKDLGPERTILVVTGDHGESFWDDGTLAHGTKASDAQCLTPLIIVGPGLQPNVLSEATHHPDIVPTLLHALGGEPVKLEGSQGRDLITEHLDDTALIAPQRIFSPYELVLVNGSQRMLLQIHFDEGLDQPPTRFEMMGFLNEKGDLDLSVRGQISDFPAWEAAWKEHLAKF